jgi:signal transduction histidine kinase
MKLFKRLLLMGLICLLPMAAGYPVGAAVAADAAGLEAYPASVLHAAFVQIGTHWTGGLAIAVVIAALAGWIVARRTTRLRTRKIHQTLLRWREGDLSARVDPASPGSPIGAIGQLLNQLAGDFQAQLNDSRVQTESLRDRLAALAGDLSEAQNRIQIEVAGRRKAESGLERAHKLQVVGQLASGIAHDFNNMLATVLGSLELMERRVAQNATEWSETDSARLQTLIERAIAAVQRGGSNRPHGQSMQTG